jgi:hypothetical protein
LGHDTDEVDDTSSRRPSRKGTLGNQARDVAALANDDLGHKREMACHFSARLGLGHRLPQDQCARRANVHGTQMLQCFGQFGRPKSPVAAHVDSSQKDNERHLWFLPSMLITVTLGSLN